MFYQRIKKSKFGLLFYGAWQYTAKNFYGDLSNSIQNEICWCKNYFFCKRFEEKMSSIKMFYSKQKPLTFEKKWSCSKIIHW